MRHEKGIPRSSFFPSLAELCFLVVARVTCHGARGERKGRMKKGISGGVVRAKEKVKGKVDGREKV